MKKQILIIFLSGMNFLVAAQDQHINGNLAVGASNRTDIGTLHVTSSDTSIQPVIRVEASTSSDLSFIRFQAKNSSAANKYTDILFDPNTENLIFKNPYNASERMTIKSNGNIVIGTSNPDMKLTVKGNIHVEEIKIDLSVPAPDYVFKKGYNLRSIGEVENFIKENNHLPEIPSAKEFEQNGVMQAEMDMNLLRKIEELTLYTIQQQKEIEELKSLVTNLLELKK